ncbi:hypothetical protein [Amycolatopsis sp. NPDC006125]|uniref:hypothetical protein n=1 Tax=Amycolatopsis sp. NPDC006125 TaxID=3156730 RepID=UPI0033AA9FED
MSVSLLNRVSRKAAAALPAGLVQLAVRVREVVAPQPWPWDEAAVRLHRMEKRGRGPLPYPHYLYGLLSAARAARALGAEAFTALEFGVAGGNGLRALEDHANLIHDWYGTRVHVVGLDSGAGLLPASDPRDCGFALHSGAFAMDETALRARLRHAELVLGDVTHTTAPLMQRIDSGDLPPLGFVAHDLDVYTGTHAALDAMTLLAPDRTLPRVPMYFDDLTGYPYTTETGERAAITAFNAKHDTRRIGQVENLEKTLGGSSRFATWPRHIFVLHTFNHPRYNTPEPITGLPDLSLRDNPRDWS